ncbi:MAG: hypothetical protein K5647_05240, partial [Clostridiales bacterium]|nr:hypothetical protein [Clostridiales bacterium]
PKPLLPLSPEKKAFKKNPKKLFYKKKKKKIKTHFFFFFLKKTSPPPPNYDIITMGRNENRYLLSSAVPVPLFLEHPILPFLS